MPSNTDCRLPAEFLIACLCAEWCGTCRDYRPRFEAQALRGLAGERYAWIDIEDEADALGEHDIETFPTLLIGDAGGNVLFFGPVLPQGQAIARLLEAARSGGLQATTDVETLALAQRLRALASRPSR